MIKTIKKYIGNLYLIPIRAIPLLFFVLSLSVSVLFASELVAEPYWLNSNLLFRYFPIFVGSFCIFIALIYFRSVHVFKRLRAALSENLFWTIYFLIAIPGVIYAKFLLKLETTYLSEILGLSVFFISCILLDFVPKKYFQIIQKWLILWLGMVSSLGLLRIVLNIILHGKTEPAAVLLFMQGFGGVIYSLSGIVQLGVALIFILFSILTFKNVALLNLAVIMMVFFVLPKNKRQITKTYLIIIFSILVVLSIIAIGFYFVFEGSFSAGHVSFRYKNILYQLDFFKNSPLWGQLFAGQTRVYFGTTKLLGDIYVPTHNDWADVLAQGGIIGFVVLAGGFIKLLLQLFNLRKNDQIIDLSIKENAMWIIVFIAIFLVTSSLNSIMGSPSIAMVNWFVFAFGHKLSNYGAWTTRREENGSN